MVEVVDGREVVTGTVDGTGVVVVAGCVLDDDTVVAVAVVVVNAVVVVVTIDGATVESVVTGPTMLDVVDVVDGVEVVDVVDVVDVATPLVAGSADPSREQADMVDVKPMTTAIQRYLRTDITDSVRHTRQGRPFGSAGAGCESRPGLRARRCDGGPRCRSQLRR